MSTDISDFLNTDFLAFTPAATATATGSSSSRESSPDSSWSLNQLLTTPPDAGFLFPSFSPPPTTTDSVIDTNGLFNFLDEPSPFVKVPQPPANPADIFLSGGFDWFGSGFGGGGQTIDPQLVAKPAPTPSTVNGEEGGEEAEDELSLKINPVKVAGHGKARKGTVLSGGVTKKNNVSFSATTPVATSPTASVSSFKENKKSSVVAKEEDDEDEEDWRPSPEALAKMTSKEKRQLRNKISARNFRVRRKEYISTLEMDIAERDRLLQAIRSELGSTQSENLALRHEIESLKNALLNGRSTTSPSDDIPSLNLPPPAPLPSLSPIISSTGSPSLFTPNMQKDVSLTSAFWGGFPSSSASPSLLFGGGVTPVHTTIIPELSTLARNVNSPPKKQENINPVMNLINSSSTAGFNKGGSATGFEGFTDSNPFTMKTLDAYRMQLWTRMAQQQQHQPHPSSPASGSGSSSSPSSSGSSSHKSSPASTPPPLISSPSMFTQPLPGGLAASLRPSFFATSNKINLVSSTNPKPSSSSSSKLTSTTKAFSSMSISSPTQKEKETAYMASLASQTLFKKLGGAFWDAFSGGAASGPASSSSRTVDADKVRKVLEGKAVVKVVDIDPATTTPKMPSVSAAAATVEKDRMTKSLEDQMCRLSLTGLNLKGR